MDIPSFSSLDAETARHSCLSQRSRLRAYRPSGPLKVEQLLYHTGLDTSQTSFADSYGYTTSYSLMGKTRSNS